MSKDNFKVKYDFQQIKVEKSVIPLFRLILAVESIPYILMAHTYKSTCYFLNDVTIVKVILNLSLCVACFSLITHAIFIRL